MAFTYSCQTPLCNFRPCDRFVGLLFLLPVLLIVAIMVKIKMLGGPAFFVQKRVGRNGKLFNCHKFRSMTVKHNGTTVSVAGDSRITPFGATLRHYKLDELPGLWDVLIGNMSFVGPRPDVPGYADKLERDGNQCTNNQSMQMQMFTPTMWKKISLRLVSVCLLVLMCQMMMSVTLSTA